MFGNDVANASRNLTFAAQDEGAESRSRNITFAAQDEGANASRNLTFPTNYPSQGASSQDVNPEGVKQFDDTMKIAKNVELEYERNRYNSAVTYATALMSAYNSRSGMSDRSLSTSFSESLQKPFLGIQILRGVGDEMKQYDGYASIVAPQVDQNGNVVCDPNGRPMITSDKLMSPQVQLQILQDAKLGDRTLPLQRELWNTLTKQYTPEQLTEKFHVRNPDGVMSNGGVTVSTPENPTVFARALAPQARHGVSAYYRGANGNSYQSYSGPETGGQRVVTNEDQNETWRAIRSGFIADAGKHGTVYENTKTGMTKFVPSGLDSEDDNQSQTEGGSPIQSADVAASARSLRKRGGGAKVDGATESARNGWSKFNKDQYDTIVNEIEAIRQKDMLELGDGVRLERLERARDSMLLGKDLQEEAAIAAANNPEEQQKRAKMYIENSVNSLFSGDGVLKGSGLVDINGESALYYKNGGSVQRAKAGDIIRLNNFTVRWDGNGNERKNFEIVDPEEEKKQYKERVEKEERRRNINRSLEKEGIRRNSKFSKRVNMLKYEEFKKAIDDKYLPKLEMLLEKNGGFQTSEYDELYKEYEDAIRKTKNVLVGVGYDDKDDTNRTGDGKPQVDDELRAKSDEREFQKKAEQAAAITDANEMKEIEDDDADKKREEKIIADKQSNALAAELLQKAMKRMDDERSSRVDEIINRDGPIDDDRVEEFLNALTRYGDILRN